VARILLLCFTGVLLAALGILLLCSIPGIFTRNEPQPEAWLSEQTQQHLYLRAVEESGAINLVSAIYLGYRAFDTLGETLVLVLSVAGVILVTGVKQ
jgi:multisubunit Na+/H+ antiporter MnhB subunit